MKQFQDKVVLVTGGNRGIGKAVCLAFGREGASVALTYHSHDEEGQAVVKEIEEAGGKGLAVKADVSNEDDVKELIQAVIDRFGKIDVLVNNAGILLQSPLIETSVETMRKMLDIDLLGVMLVSKAVLPHMIDAKSGRIINVSSQLGQIGGDELTAYCAAKGGVIAFTKALARELGSSGMDTGILVNCVAPGPIETDLIGGLSDKWKKNKEAELPLGRFGRPEEVAPTILFLAGEGASLYIGQVLSPNSGDTMVG